MNSEKSETVYKRIIRILIGVTWLIAFMAGLIFIYGQCFDRHDVLKVGVSNKISTDWSYTSSNGSSGTCKTPVRVEIPIGASIEFNGTMPEDITDGMYMIIAAGRNIAIYIDGQARLVHTQADSKIPGKIVKSGFFPIQLYESDAGKPIKIVKDEAGAYNGYLGEIRYGDLYAVCRSIMSEHAFKFIAALLLLVISIGVSVGNILISAFYKIHDKALRMLAYGMLAISVWIITDSYMYQFAFGNIYVEGTVSYIIAPLIPVSFIRYINELQKSRYEKLYAFVIALLILDELVTCFLHFTDILSFERTLKVSNFAEVSACLLMVVLFYGEYRNGHLKEYKWVAAGLAGLVLSAILEIIFINTTFPIFSDLWLILGIYFMLITALVHTAGDIINREKERRKAIEASIVKSNFLANMSHEIRTPINAIMGMNEMILRESSDPNIAEYSEHINRSGKLLLSIIGDVLDLSRIESGKLNMVNGPYNISSFISDVYNLMNQMAVPKNLEVKFDVDKDIPRAFFGDENHIKQVVINLITNAAKYTKKGFIGLKAYVTDIKECYDELTVYKVATVNIEISDSGIGIKKDDIPKLFNSFERVDEKKNRNIQGTGLGLSIVKSLTEAMGGKVEVRSEYGKGSTFIVRFPQKVVDESPVGDAWMSMAEYKAGAMERTRYKASFTAHDARIMAVDDNGSNLMIIKQLLKETGLEIELVDNGKDAIELADEKHFDVILLDHMMPEPDGIAVLKAIKSNPLGINKLTPVIVLTANATENSREEYLSAGFSDYISKPVDGRTLENMLYQYLPPSKVMDNNVEHKAASATSAPVASVADSSKSGESNDYNGLFNREEFAKLAKVYGNKQFAYEIMSKVALDTLQSLDKLKEDIDTGNYGDYAIRAHGIKGMMASVYYEALRTRSYEHEMAAKEGRIDYIKQDYEGYSTECRQFCTLILGTE